MAVQAMKEALLDSPLARQHAIPDSGLECCRAVLRIPRQSFLNESKSAFLSPARPGTSPWPVMKMTGSMTHAVEVLLKFEAAHGPGMRISAPDSRESVVKFAKNSLARRKHRRW